MFPGIAELVTAVGVNMTAVGVNMTVMTDCVDVVSPNIVEPPFKVSLGSGGSEH
jgi:hypothetical protein